MAIDLYQPLLLGIDRDLTFHAVENPGFKRRRLEGRVGSEVECHEIALRTNGHKVTVDFTALTL